MYPRHVLLKKPRVPQRKHVRDAIRGWDRILFCFTIPILHRHACDLFFYQNIPRVHFYFITFLSCLPSLMALKAAYMVVPRWSPIEGWTRSRPASLQVPLRTHTPLPPRCLISRFLDFWHLHQSLREDLHTPCTLGVQHSTDENQEGWHLASFECPSAQDQSLVPGTV